MMSDPTPIGIRSTICPIAYAAITKPIICRLAPSSLAWSGSTGTYRYSEIQKKYVASATMTMFRVADRLARTGAFAIPELP